MDLHRTLESFDVNLTGRERVALLRRHALHLKYSQAVEFYADTDKPLRVIADECGVTVGGIIYGGIGVNWCCKGIRF